MQQIKALWLGVSVLLFSTCEPSTERWRAPALEMRTQAIQYLLGEQQADGSWRSTTHGILKGGVAYTAYLATSLQESRNSNWTAGRLDAACTFLLPQIDSSGGLGYRQPYVVEYPVYATAYAYRVISYAAPAVADTVLPQLQNYLLQQQFTAARRVDTRHQAYGAWGFGEQGLPDGEVGHVDLSHTRRVLETLQLSGLAASATAWKDATVFLERIQNSDGGFCSSSHTLGANKADDQDHQCVSYATATADGVLALLSFPAPPTGQLRAAAKWLWQNEDWRAPAGIRPEQAGNWDQVLFYYHLSVRAQAYAKLEQSSLLPETTSRRWRGELLNTLQDQQQADGSFSNPWGAPNKEDDPLLATALVVRALNAVLGVG